MKKFSFRLAITLLICFNASADDNKLYISSNNIMIAENGIFIKIDGYIAKTNCVFQDDVGIYIFDLDLKAVKCPECGRDYPSYEKKCPYRGMHDDKDGV